MAIFVITLCAIALTLLPLQWQLPFHFFEPISRDPWNGPVIVLHCVSGFFYLAVFLGKKKWLEPTVIRNCLIITAVLLGWWLISDSPKGLAIELSRLLSIIWFMPVIAFVLKRLGAPRLAWLLIAITVLHAQWGMIQFIIQDDVGLYLLGETRLDTTSPGIARFTVTTPDGTPHKLLRAYGPYPHPNSLAGVLTIGMSGCLLLLLRKNSLALAIAAGSIFAGLLLTFSRSAAIAAAITMIVALHIRRTTKVEHKKLWGILVFMIITTLVFVPFWRSRLTDTQDVAAAERVLGTQAAWQLIQSNPWIGVGTGQYEVALQHFLETSGFAYQPWQIAPVHSAPLLIMAQVGLLGSLLVAIGIAAYLRQRTWRQLRWLVPLLPLLLFDHYLLTQVAPLVMLLGWLWLLPHLAPYSDQRFPVVTPPGDS